MVKGLARWVCRKGSCRSSLGRLASAVCGGSHGRAPSTTSTRSHYSSSIHLILNSISSTDCWVFRPSGLPIPLSCSMALECELSRQRGKAYDKETKTDVCAGPPRRRVLGQWRRPCEVCCRGDRNLSRHGDTGRAWLVRQPGGVSGPGGIDRKSV